MALKFSKFFRQYAIILVLIALVIGFSILAPAFLSLNNAMNVLRQISMTSIVAVGFTFVLIGGGLDLSVGSQIALVNVIVPLMITNLGMPPVLAVIIGIATTTAIGFFNGYTITKTGVPPLIATLAMMTTLRGLVFILTKGYPIYGIPDYLKVIGQGNIFGIIPVPGVIMACVIAFGIILLNKTYIGRHFYALGSNTEATRLAGINIHFTRTATYTLLGFLTGIAGIVMVTRVGSGQPNIATGFEMDVLIACVLGGVSVFGGKGTIPGAIIGAAIIGILNNGMAIVGANDYWQQVITGIVLFSVVVLDSIGQKYKRPQKDISE